MKREISRHVWGETCAACGGDVSDDACTAELPSAGVGGRCGIAARSERNATLAIAVILAQPLLFLPRGTLVIESFCAGG